MSVPDRRSIRPQSHIINILKGTRDHHPNFALFLGAGASVTSGVRDAGSLIKEWRSQYHATYGGTKSLEEFLKTQSWYETPDEYSILFEHLFDQASQRREFIESCITKASPSWGYIYLVNAIRHEIFTTVFTTNFDDLINEACYQFSHEVRPIVCAHDSSIRTVRVTSKRPKLIKLHGDFLFDNIKNTVRELETLEQNTKEKFRQYASEFGLIMVGYSGRDRSIMDAIGSMLRNEDNFPHGIYWAIRKGDEASAAVKALGRFPKVTFFEVVGFDEFFADLNQELGLSLQLEMADPYRALADRLNGLVESARIPTEGQLHPVIARDIQKIRESVTRVTETPVTKASSGSEQPAPSRQAQPSVPREFLAQTERQRGNYSRAMELLFEELESNPSMRLFEQAFYIAVEHEEKSFLPKLSQLFAKAKATIAQSPDLTHGIAVKLIKKKEFDLALEVLELGKEASAVSKEYWNEDFYVLNKLQIKKHLKRDFLPTEKETLTRLLSSPSKDTQMGAAILLGEFELARETIDNISGGEGIPAYMRGWPILDLLPPSNEDLLTVGQPIKPTPVPGPTTKRKKTGSKPVRLADIASGTSEIVATVPTRKSAGALNGEATKPRSKK